MPEEEFPGNDTASQEEIDQVAEEQFKEVRQSEGLENSLLGQMKTLGFEKPSILAKAQVDVVASGVQKCIQNRCSEGIQKKRVKGVVKDCQKEMRSYAIETSEGLLEKTLGEEKKKEEKKETPKQPAPQGILGGMRKNMDSVERILSQVPNKRGE